MRSALMLLLSLAFLLPPAYTTPFPEGIAGAALEAGKAWKGSPVSAEVGALPIRSCSGY
jgi:hypothetical protein